jgi:hypothetical protein
MAVVRLVSNTEIGAGADLIRKSAASSAKAVYQRVVFDVVQAYQRVLYAERLASAHV